MPSLTLVKGDRTYYLEFEVRDADGDLVDLTGCSIGFKMQKYGESDLTLNKAGQVISPGSLGVCQILIENELVNESGEYIAELEIRWPTGKILTAPSIYVKILQDLPR